MIRPTASGLLALAAVVLALSWSAFLARAHLEARETVLDRLEASLVDVRVLAAGRRPSPPGVLIVAVDDATARWAKAFPLPRRVLAGLVTALFEAGAKAVALDFLFFDPGAPDDDAALAGALRGGPAVSAITIDFARAVQAAASVYGPAAACGLPIDIIRKATSVGFVNIAVDRSGIARHVPMLLACADNVVPALALRAASLAVHADPAFEPDAVVIGDVAVPLDADRSLALWYYGPEGSVDTVSAVDLLTGAIAPERVRGKTVLIGATASGTGDRYPTPFDSVLPGVEILATAVANLETGKALVRTAGVRRIDAALMIGLACAAVLFLTMRNIVFGLAGVLALFAALVAFTFAGFASGYWFALAMPLASMGPAAALTAAARLGLDRWTERKMLRQQLTLAAFQSPAILAHLSADPDFLSKPVEREIAAVFIDLTGYTGLTERLGAHATRDLLKAFHELVEGEARTGGGIVAAYMADGAMLVWGMARAGPDDALKAVRTALALAARTLDWLEGIAPQSRGALTVKLGGDIGPAILSRLGDATHQHITAVGDTVNIASRLMEVAAERGYVLALSGGLLARAAAQGLSAGEGRFTEPADAPIRGREQAVSAAFWIPAAEA